MVDMSGGWAVSKKSVRHRGRILSASLILAASPSPSSPVQYLMTKRSDDHPMLAGAMCFPGGKFSGADASADWEALYNAEGLSLLEMEFLYRSAQRPEVYEVERTDDDNGRQLPYEIALRITAIRETFEECGILLCIRRGEPFTEVQLGSENATLWQQRVMRDPVEFLVLCKQFQCLPDLEALNEWNNWVTPAFFSPRFDTVFYLAILPSPVQATIDPMEVEYAEWMTAKDALEKHWNSEIFLPSPQFYETTRLQGVSALSQLQLLTSLRKKFGIERLCPQYYAVEDGFILAFPGDYLYDETRDPDDPSLPQILESGESIAQTPVGERKHYHRILTRDSFRPVKMEATAPFRFGSSYDVSRSVL